MKSFPSRNLSGLALDIKALAAIVSDDVQLQSRFEDQVVGFICPISVVVAYELTCRIIVTSG